MVVGDLDEDVELVDERFVETGVARATLKPTMAIAPTLDERDRVVVAMLQSKGSLEAVDAYVRTAPFDMVETQLPLTGPLVAISLE